ncbi:hypothetical protein [Desulfovibrio sp. MES5]|uniref:hypothetical protein n=1 Tax=Desulfovibrio sp. MES5 TaxID=1899016 RepID=UPI0025BEEDC8|nr:hypothetical protein [Desulfovibrio sp. MES5]
MIVMIEKAVEQAFKNLSETNENTGPCEWAASTHDPGVPPTLAIWPSFADAGLCALHLCA